MKRTSLVFNPERIFFIISIFLIFLSLAYLIRGFYYLNIADNGAGDLLARWQEQQYIYRGIYPYDVRVGSPDVIPEIGAIHSGGYPPWAFFTGFIFLPPISWKLTRFYHALLNFFSLIILALFSYQIGIPYGRSKALFSIVASLAISSHASTLGLGQYGIIINALLIGMFWLLKKYQDIWAGLAFAMAMVKPNISALYLFVLIIHKRNKAILAFSLYIILASINIWIITKLDPIYMLNSVIAQSKYFAHEGYSGINLFTSLGLEPKVATILLALVGTGAITISIIFFNFWRNYSLLNLFATASVIGRIWTYHRIYDNVMLIFLLLAMLKMTFSNFQKLNILMLLLVSISLWLPVKSTDLAFIKVAQFIIWIIALCYLLIQSKNNRESLSN